MKLSIIIPTLMYGSYYDEIIENLNKLGYGKDNPDVEIITIENKLVNEAWNEGVALSSGDYIMIINDDIIIHEKCIDVMMALLEHHTISCPLFTRGADNQTYHSSNLDNICGFCFMFKRESIPKLFPICKELKIRYGDNWLYHKANKDIGWGGRIHHWESKTLLSPEHRERVDRLIKGDMRIWRNYIYYSIK